MEKYVGNTIGSAISLGKKNEKYYSIGSFLLFQTIYIVRGLMPKISEYVIRLDFRSNKFQSHSYNIWAAV